MNRIRERGGEAGMDGWEKGVRGLETEAGRWETSDT